MWEEATLKPKWSERSLGTSVGSVMLGVHWQHGAFQINTLYSAPVATQALHQEQK